MFPHGVKGQNESCRELQNGSELGPSEFDWFLRGGGGEILPVSGRNLIGFYSFFGRDWIGFWRGI